MFCPSPLVNGHFRFLNWRYIPTTHMAKNMVQAYLNFRILNGRHWLPHRFHPGPSPQGDRRSRPRAVHTGSRAGLLRHLSPLPGWLSRWWQAEPPLKPWENHGKTMGKPWENHGKTMGTWWFYFQMVMSEDELMFMIAKLTYHFYYGLWQWNNCSIDGLFPNVTLCHTISQAPGRLRAFSWCK